MLAPCGDCLSWTDRLGTLLCNPEVYGRSGTVCRCAAAILAAQIRICAAYCNTHLRHQWVKFSLSFSLARRTQRRHLRTAACVSLCPDQLWQDWVTCHEDIKEVSQVCSRWLKSRGLKVSPEAFQALWCHNNVLGWIGFKSVRS